MKITKNQLKQIINEELDTVMSEVGMFGRLKNRLTGQTAEAGKLSAKIWRWVKENDLIGKFGGNGESTGADSWKSQNDVNDWAQDNFEKAKALYSATLGAGAPKGFEDVRVVRDAAHLDSLEPSKSEKERGQDARAKAKAQQDKEADLAVRNRKVEKSIADKAAAKKKKAADEKSAEINAAGRLSDQERYKQRMARDARQKERNAVRYGPQDF